MDIIEELHQVEVIREAGCNLHIDSGRYVMENDRDVSDRHSLDVEHTSAARLEAHWQAFADIHRAQQVAA